MFGRAPRTLLTALMLAIALLAAGCQTSSPWRKTESVSEEQRQADQLARQGDYAGAAALYESAGAVATRRRAHLAADLRRRQLSLAAGNRQRRTTSCARLRRQAGIRWRPTTVITLGELRLAQNRPPGCGRAPWVPPPRRGHRHQASRATIEVMATALGRLQQKAGEADALMRLHDVAADRPERGSYQQQILRVVSGLERDRARRAARLGHPDTYGLDRPGGRLERGRNRRRRAGTGIRPMAHPVSEPSCIERPGTTFAGAGPPRPSTGTAAQPSAFCCRSQAPIRRPPRHCAKASWRPFTGCRRATPGIALLRHGYRSPHHPALRAGGERGRSARDRPPDQGGRVGPEAIGLLPRPGAGAEPHRRRRAAGRRASTSSPCRPRRKGAASPNAPHGKASTTPPSSPRATERGTSYVENFRRNWEAMGGYLSAVTEYNPEEHDLAAPIREATSSGADFFYVIGKPLKARQLRTQIQFFGRADTPVFLSGQALQDMLPATQNPDLNGAHIPGMPWLLPPGKTAEPSTTFKPRAMARHHRSRLRPLLRHGLRCTAHRLEPESAHVADIRASMAPPDT